MKNPLVSLAISLLLASGIPALAAPPDLTNGGVPGDTISTNLGPTGLRGWVYHVREDSSESRQIQVKSVTASSPASSFFAANDVILGANGSGAAPVNFTSDARRAFADALNDAEARNPATLQLIRWRAGVTTTVTLTLRTMGAYTATAPYNCPKSALILEEGLQFIQGGGETAGAYSFGTLALIAGNNTANPNNAARRTRAQTEARAKVPSASVRATMMSDARDATSFSAWDRGHTLVMLAEYFLLTGDTQVLPGVEAYAVNIAKNHSMFGTTGHMYARKNTNGSANGALGNGYGCVNSAAMPCYLGLLLAKKCGLTNPEIAQGIQRSSRFYAYYSGKGAIPYGEHESYWAGHESNGKCGLAAVCFGLEPTRATEGKFFARMATAAASERGEGHTGAFFNYLWAPLGAAVGGEESVASYFARTRWMFDLARRPNGSFVYDSLTGEGPDSGSTYNDYRMSTAMLLTYALPLRQLEITGKTPTLPANILTSPEVTAAAAADTYDPAPRTTTELIADLGNWSPKVHRNAALELAKRSINSTVLAQITALANDVNGTSRYAACITLGNIVSSTTVAARANTLVALLTDPDGHVRFMAAEAMRSLPQATKMTHLNTLLTLCASQARPLLPLPEDDPMQLAHGRLCILLFNSDRGVIWNNFTGVDRALLLPAIRAVVNHPTGYVRSSVPQIFSMLNQQEILDISDAIVNSVEHHIPADRMFGKDTQAPTIAKLAQYKISEAVPISKVIINREDTLTIKTEILAILESYGGSSTTIRPDPGITAFLEILKQSTDTAAAAQAVLDAIHADPNPQPALPLKSLAAISADAPSITLPANQTTLRATGFDYAKGASVFTWRKIHGKSDPTFTPNDTAAAKDSTVQIAGLPGKYRFEVTLSDSRGFTEVTRTVDVDLLDSTGVLPPNSPPTANGQSLNVTRGISLPITVNGTDPEAFPLIYRIVTPPADGELTGTLPNLTYQTNPGGSATSDSFTFEVMDSEGQIATAVVALSIDNSVRAEGILWGAATNTTSPTNVVTTGTFVDSRTGQDNSGTITVNGVTFLQGRIFATTATANTSICPDTGTGAENVALESLLDRISSVGSSFQLTGLTPGTKYLVQIFLCDNRGTRNIDFADDSGMTNKVRLTSRPAGAFGQHVIGTFTAATSTQTIYVTAASGSTYINSWQLRQLPDGASPTPSPLTWATPPTASGMHTVTMTATTAADPNGVEYFFDETSGKPGATDSGWQDSPVYSDALLAPGKTYTYRVTARDKSFVKNATLTSAAVSVTTASSNFPPIVWNVNIGNEITTSDNFKGAATENTTTNSTWNSVINPLPKTNVALVTSSGLASPARLDISAVNGTNNHQMASTNLTSGPEIFRSYIGGAGSTVTLLLHGLPANHTYDLVIYSDWFWKNGDSGYPVTQTIGTGLSGTIFSNRIFTPYVNGQVPPLQEDTNPLDVQPGSGNGGNWYRVKNLTPDASGQLGFRTGDTVNGPINGFQLIGIPNDPGDLVSPAPNAMTWASVPTATDPTSVTMTATTATDLDGVEYLFEETSNNPGGTDGTWQDSPIFTDTGLTTGTSYTYRVKARDKSPNANETSWSPSQSVTPSLPPTDYNIWSSLYPSADLTDPIADFDNDGLTNHEERAFGLDPTSGSSSNPISVPLNPATGTFSYTRRRISLTSLTYTVRSTTTMASNAWTDLVKDTHFTESVTTAGDVETVTITLTPVPASSKFFVHVRAQ